LRLDTSAEARNIKAVVKTGELSLTPEPPALIREGSIYEISLAQILIIHNTTAIPVENVTDERLDSEVCGLANIALTYEEFALKQDTGDINDDTLPAELKGKPLTEQIMYVLEHAGKVKSVNGKTGEVVIDVGDIAGLNSISTIIGDGAVGETQIGCVSIGLRASASGFNSVALGPYAETGAPDTYEGNSAVAIGMRSKAMQHDAVAIGRLSQAGYNAIALGGNTLAFSNSITIGAGSETGGDGAIALGIGAFAANTNSCRLGTSDSEWSVPGKFSVSGTKNFEIPHPKPEKSATHVIRHGAVESPTPGDTLYRWKVQATKDNDIVTIDLPDYFIYLNKDVQIWVTGQGHFGNGYGELNRETEQLEIHCQYEGEYNVLVIGTRNDDHQSVQDWYIKGVEREIGESWTGETYAFEVDEIIEIEEIKEVSV